MLRGNLGFRIKYRVHGLLDAVTNRMGGFAIYDIRGKRSVRGRHALVIYTAAAVSEYLKGRGDSFSLLRSHSGFTESVTMLEALLDAGYTVDYADMYRIPEINWKKYELVIDAAGTIEKAPVVSGQRRIYYSTSCHWKVFNSNSYRHIESFYNRHQIIVCPDRELKPNYADDAADIISCFGGQYQAASFLTNQHKVRNLSISTTAPPAESFRKRIASQRQFLWFGGYGPMHKGLDIVVEAFIRRPDLQLHIAGDIASNAKFYAWFQSVTANVKNIRFHGWITPDDSRFTGLVEACDGIVFTSSSEGGAGSVIQCMQYGLIPLVNKQTALDLPDATFQIAGDDPLEQISALAEQLDRFSQFQAPALQEISDKISAHYTKKNSIESYRVDLRNLLK
jgi:hypothetical protein